MKKWYKAIMALVCVGVFALAILPIVSVDIVGGESGTVIVRGYNLMEFSPWGVIPLMTPILVFFILFGNQSQAMKEAEILLLFAGSMVCYVHSFHLSVEWLRSVGTSMITRHIGMTLYPSALIALLMFAQISDNDDVHEDVVDTV